MLQGQFQCRLKTKNSFKNAGLNSCVLMWMKVIVGTPAQSETGAGGVQDFDKTNTVLVNKTREILIFCG